MDKIEGLIISHVQNEACSYQFEYCKRPTYVVLGPWMVSVLKESMKNLLHYTNGTDKEVHTLCGLIIIESVKVKDLSEIEVY